MAASQSNGLVPPPAKRQVAPIGNDNYTLDFSFIFLVNGGSHYQVGDAVQVGNVGSAIPATIIVDSVVTDSFGTTGVIATWHLSGTPITAQPYHALSSPARPFTSTGGHGSGATWDVSRGDGSQLSFIPAYAPAVVPVPTGLTGVYWPRNTFFSWSGATPGGADPVADYFTSKGVAVQSTLPDGYGTPQLKRYGYVDVNGVVTVQDGVPPDYMLGFTPAFQTKAGTYRWISIDAARSFYATENIPFVCPATAATILSFIKNQDWSVEVISVDGPHVLPAPFPPLPFDVNSAGFVPVADGNWLTTLIIPILPGPLPLVRPIFVQRNLSVIFVGSYIISVLLQPFGYIFQASLAVSIVAENTVPVVVYCMPKNYASSDPSAFIHASRANLDAYNELGDSIVPVAADNSVEGHAPEATYIDGVGGAGAHETVIVTGLACATLSIVPVTGNS
jgi:hypothetical protein